MDIIELQNSILPIRNPFGFDFVCTWGKKPVILAGDGEWKNVIKPLREHIAHHLYFKIYHQYYDEQKEIVRKEQGDKAARRYLVPTPVQDKIWNLITGEATRPERKAKPAHEAEIEADLTALKDSLNQLDKSARTGNHEPLNISALIDKANNEALTGGMARPKGTGSLNGIEVPAAPIDTTPVMAEQAAVPQRATVAPAATEEFSGLQELD